MVRWRVSVAVLGMAGALALLLSGPVAAGVCDEDCMPEIVKLPSKGKQTCYKFSATMDGGGGDHAIKRSQQALKETIDSFRRTQPPSEGWMGRLRITPMKPEPTPYIRSSVSPDLMLGTFSSKEADTVCWRGVLAPVVCTSSAKVCR